MDSGNTREEADSDHEQYLQKRLHRKNVRMNDEKSALKQTQIRLLSHLITDKGVKPGKSKVQATLSMPASTDVHGVKRFVKRFSSYQSSSHTRLVIYNQHES